jgi:hypothetical protein
LREPDEVASGLFECFRQAHTDEIARALASGEPPLGGDSGKTSVSIEQGRARIRSVMAWFTTATPPLINVGPVAAFFLAKLTMRSPSSTTEP